MKAAEELYQASPIRRRHRSTKAEVEARRDQLFEIIDARGQYHRGKRRLVYPILRL
jgi:hypothetical protein